MLTWSKPVQHQSILIDSMQIQLKTPGIVKQGKMINKSQGKNYRYEKVEIQKRRPKGSIS